MARSPVIRRSLPPRMDCNSPPRSEICCSKCKCYKESFMYSQYAANKILDATDRGIAFSVAASYVGLFLAMPGLDDTGGTEVSGVSYARQAISFGAAATDRK